MSTIMVNNKSRFQFFRDKDYRSGQLQAIDFVQQSTKPVIIISAPVGSGKSLLGMTVAADGYKSAYICSSKPLQEQLQQDFPEAKLLKGRSNYPCLSNPSLSAADCTHSLDSQCSNISRCPYRIAKQECMRHDLQILNYSYLLTESNYLGEQAQCTNYDWIICDEADVLETELSRFVEINITERDLRNLGVSNPRYKTCDADHKVLEWMRWANDELLPMSRRKLHEMEENKPTEPDDLTEHNKSILKLSSIIRKTRMLTENLTSNWIVDYNKLYKSYSIRPIWLTPTMTADYLLRHTDRLILMSGTWPPKQIIAHSLGIPIGDIDMIEIPSTFPKENRPVYLCNAANMVKKTYDNDLPKLIEAIKKIITMHPDQKGIIHTASYKLTSDIMSAIDSSRLITHTASNKEQIIDQYKASDKPLVFVSPSSTRGIDLPDDYCRFGIIAKAPFPYLGDKLIAARAYSAIGNVWYRSICAQEIQQAVGRNVRNEDDHAVNYILDTAACNLITREQHLFNNYFMESIDWKKII